MKKLNNQNRKSLGAVRERERERESYNLGNKAKRSVIVRNAVICGALICAGAVIIATVKNKPKLEIAAKKVDEPMAITEVGARTPNLNNVHYEPSLEKDEKGEYIQVPVPRGYVASEVDDERYINGVTENGERVHSGGFVIYEGTEPVTSENLDEAQRTRNQYVWVPIDKETEAIAGKMYRLENGLLYGNYYEFTESGAGDPKTGRREPCVLENLYPSYFYDYDQTYLKKYMEGISRSEFLQEMREEFYEMIVSVKTYGGFYIGRYETGNINQNRAVVVRENSNISGVSWYTTYKRCRALRGTAPVKTSMIWGIQWDETLKWLIESGEKTAAEINDSTTWGNYSNSTVSGHGSIRPSGYSDEWIANNIYDLAGNVYEWTMESDYRSAEKRYARGGGYLYNANNNGNAIPVSKRYLNLPFYDSGMGQRTALYLS